MKKHRIKRNIAFALAFIMVIMSIFTNIPVTAKANTAQTTIYFIDDTPEKWIANDGAMIELVDNTQGHQRYIMTKQGNATWSANVPASAYNITFNRYNSDKSVLWNSWSAGGRDGKVTYKAEGTSHGKWTGDVMDENCFKEGDIIYLDVTDFTDWMKDNAVFYVNFTNATKVENGGKDVNLSTGNKSLYNPIGGLVKIKENIYSYKVTEQDAGASVLRFWRGSATTLWNYSVALSYEKYKAGYNCVKVSGWNESGSLATIEVESQEDANWNKKMIQADTDIVEATRDNVQDIVKVGLIDSGVDFHETIPVVARRDFVNGDDEERTPLFEDESGHGTAAAAVLAASEITQSDDEDEEEENNEEETQSGEPSLDFSYVDETDAVTLTPTLNEDTKKLFEEGQEDDTDDETEEDEEEILEEDDEEEIIDEDEIEDEEEPSLYDLLQADQRVITGINPNVEIYSAKVLDENNEAPVSRVVEGIEWAIDEEVNILHIGFSLEKDSPALRQVIQKAYKKGILIVAPAGNDGVVEYPAKYKEVMAVGSVNCEGEIAEQSAAGTEIEVVAPGENVYSIGAFGVIDTFSGTSMAVPQVVGLASLLWQKDISKSNEFIRQLIIVTANNIGEEEQYGYGIIDCDYALRHYDEFAEVFSDGNSIEESLEQVQEADVIEENENELETFEEDIVIGRWEGPQHRELAGSLDIVKKGASWQDKIISGLDRMTVNPGFHGYIRRQFNKDGTKLTKENYKANDFIASYLYLTKQAVRYSKTGKYYSKLQNTKVTGDNLLFTHNRFKEKIGIAWEEYSQDTKTNIKKAQFVYGMAIHTATDLYAHSAYRNVTGDSSKISNVWRIIQHKKDKNDNPVIGSADSTKMIGSEGKAVTNLRYIAAKKVSDNMLKHIKQTSVKAGNADDFYGGTIYLKIPSAKLSTKIKVGYLKDAFSIPQFYEYIKKHTSSSNTKLLNNTKRIDNATVKKAVNKWIKIKLAADALRKKMKTADNKIKFQLFNIGGRRIDMVEDGDDTIYVDRDTPYYLMISAQDSNNPDKRVVCTKLIHHSQVDESLFLENDEYQVMFLESELELTEEDFVTTELKGKVTIANPNSSQSNLSVLPNANIKLVDFNETSYTLAATTDAEGMYSFDDIAPGIYTMTIQKDGYLDAQYTVIVKRGEHNVYNPVIAMIDTKYEGKGNASGKIVNAITANGVSGLTLKFRPGLGELKKNPVAETKTGANGVYTINQLEAGHYTVQIVDERENAEVKYADSIMNVIIMGGCTITEQNGVVTSGLEKEQIRIVLTWGAQPSDLDSHLLGVTDEGNNFHIYYGNKIAGSNDEIEAMLDVDMIESYGPETTTIYKPSDGDYDFYVHNFSRGSVDALSNSGAVVQVFKGDSNLPWHTFYVPQGQGYYWNVFRYEGATGRMIPYGNITRENAFD